MDNDVKQIKDLIDRYVYQVGRWLPAAQRADIERELRGLIDDMLAARTDEPAKEDVNAVLRELGHPAELAAKYSGAKSFLIGPEYFGIYLTVLKIVLAASGLGMLLAQAIGFAATPPQNVWSAIGLFFASIFNALVQAFAWVTAIFAIIERCAKEAPYKGKEWNPADLPPVPERKLEIKRSEPIVGIVFTVLFLVVVNTMPQLLGVYVFSGVHAVVPVLDFDVFYRLLPLIDVMICLGIVKELLRLIVGRYTIGLSLSLVVINVLSMVLFIWLFGPSSEIWNPDFMTRLGAVWNLPSQASYAWSIFPKILVGLCIFGNVVDSIQLIVRALRRAEPAAA